MSKRHLIAIAAFSMALGGFSCKGGDASDGPASAPDGAQLTMVFAGNNIGEIEPCG